MVQGAITGAVAAATEGTSLVSQGMAQAGANIVGGLIGRDIAGVKTTKTDVFVDTVAGGLSPVVGAKGGSMLSSLVGNKTVAEAESKMGSKLGERHAASVAKQVQAAQTAEKTMGAVAKGTLSVTTQTSEKKVDDQN